MPWRKAYPKLRVDPYWESRKLSWLLVSMVNLDCALRLSSHSCTIFQKASWSGACSAYPKSLMSLFLFLPSTGSR